MRRKLSDDIVFSGAFVQLRKSRSFKDIDVWLVILSFLALRDIRHLTLTNTKFLSLRNDAIDHAVGQAIISRISQETPASFPRVFYPPAGFFEIKDLSHCHNQEFFFQEIEILHHQLMSCKTHFGNNGKTLTVTTNDKKIKFCTETAKLISIKDHTEEETLVPEHEFTRMDEQDENSAIAFSEDNHFAIVKNDGSGKYYSFDPITQKISIINEWQKSLTITTNNKPIVHFRDRKQLVIRICDILIIRQLEQNIIIHQSRFPTEETCAITSYGNHLFFIALKNERVGIQRFSASSDLLSPPEIRSRKRSRE